MTSFFFSIFNWIAANRWAQIVLSLGAVLLVIKVKAEHDEARGERQARRKIEKRAQKTAQKIQHKGEQDVEKAIEAGRAAPVYPDAGSVPDDIARDIFHD